MPPTNMLLCYGALAMQRNGIYGRPIPFYVQKQRDLKYVYIPKITRRMYGDPLIFYAGFLFYKELAQEYPVV